MDPSKPIPLMMPEEIGWPQPDHNMIESNSLKQQSNLPNSLTNIQVQMEGMFDVASMIEAYSVWLMLLTTHELICCSSTKKNYLFCPEHGPSRRRAIAFAKRLIDGNFHAGKVCKDNDSHFVHRWPLELSEDSEILIIFKEKPGEEEISLINDSLEILGESLKRGLEYEDLLEHANRDMLTGLSNRQAFDEGIKEMMEKARRHHYPLTLLSIDLDHFKDINDTLGDPAGDDVLKSVAKTFSQAVRSTDLLSRIGGDEFLLVLDNTDKISAQVLAGRLWRAVDKLDIWADNKVKLGVSISIAQLQEDETLSQWLERADDILYQAKTNGYSICDRPSYFLNQERDLQLFLDSLGLQLPPLDSTLPDDYVVLALAPHAASILGAKDNKAVLLAYRFQGSIFPIALVFLRGLRQVQFCHSTLLLDEYRQGDGTISLLRKAVKEFFSRDADSLLEAMEPSWVNTDLTGQLDCRILWNIKPEMSIVTDLFNERHVQVCDIPVFPTVYYYNNPYEQNLLEVALPRLEGAKDVLVLGTGAGLEAVCVAMKYGVHVDATDINPIAVANTISASKRTGTDHLVKAWLSNGFLEVKKAYDAILFEAPLATEQTNIKDHNRFDLGGRLLREVFSALPSHLNAAGRMYLMSHADLSRYLPARGLRSKVLRKFKACETERELAIHEIWKE